LARLPSAIIDNSATNVLLNGGNEKLTGQRPAISHSPKKSANEINCHKKEDIGALERWSTGVRLLNPITPILHYNVPKAFIT